MENALKSSGPSLRTPSPDWWLFVASTPQDPAKATVRRLHCCAGSTVCCVFAEDASASFPAARLVPGHVPPRSRTPGPVSRPNPAKRGDSMKTSTLSLLALALASTGLTSLPAAAQDDLQRGETVLERRRPELEQLGVRAGSFLFAPDAPLEQAYQAQLEKAVLWTAQPEERACRRGFDRSAGRHRTSWASGWSHCPGRTWHPSPPVPTSTWRCVLASPAAIPC